MTDEQEWTTHSEESEVVEEHAESAEIVDESTHEDSKQMEILDLQNKLLRAHADFDNFKRRTRQEKEELSLYASAKLVTDLLPVLDNFALALKSAETSSGSDGLAKGVDMVFKQLQSVLDSAGLRTMDVLGHSFDPNLHEAVVSEHVEDRDPGVILEVLRPGYFLKDKVLRAAMVKVSE
ncbi:MAG: nucleotide exchange factor GrpE [Acidibacillus sp.]|uniref:Protein GrpE n=1 Tax=Sulfoacidibacillus ferrooxidans TaxID=2005001 RepID=A0A9X1V9B6_9BACL|nr:nucleotide exchange factor GrpE [Sulfoacidibacillus ferrooxidans]MCI0181897.1 Protein GrpE [Sulfoacidibacillus ferrooxidans]MCY0892806.1 nucleotide exchange factor GrpE [Acidibacillus sp.]